MRAAAPTSRAAGLVAAAALAALLVPVWLAVAAVVAVLAAGVIDARTVRRPPALDRELPTVLSRGTPAPLHVRVRASAGGRTILCQPSHGPLHVEAAMTGPGELRGTVVALRRGRHVLPGTACATVGPLGLARVHHPATGPVAVRAYPDVAAALAAIARLRRRGVASQIGRAAGPLGLGTEFEQVRDYTPDDDIRQLNPRASARLGRPMSNQYRIERDRDLLCLLDTGRLMSAPQHDGTMLDVALDALTLVALAADELGDRCGAIAFDAGIRRHLLPAHRAGRRVIEALFELEPRSRDSDFELAAHTAGAARRAFVLVLTDLVDEAAARSLLEAMPMLARRHAVAVASASDERLAQVAARAPRSVRAAAEQLAALDVLAARERTAARIRGYGAEVIEAPAAQLPVSCLRAYLRAKARARL